MRVRPAGFVVAALLSGMPLIGCAGGGASATNPAAALPAAVAHQPGVVPHGGVRRPQDVPICSGTGTDAFVGGGSGNVADGAYSGVLDGNLNEVCDLDGAIAGGYANYISSGAGTAYNSFIGSGYDNTISGGGALSFIGSGSHNSATTALGVVVGGTSNALNGEYGFIGGGSTNALSSEYGVLVGGLNNTVSGEGAYIAAGGYNTASGEGAVVDGGFASTASGTFSTIPGGYRNSASGTYSLAAGAFAGAANEGVFVWSDGSDGSTLLTSSRAYQFLARAAGGFTLYTNPASTVGAQLAAGSGTWASLSDRNVKTNIIPLDDASVLAKLAALPISRWSYKTEHGVRHVGPMAQDFYAAFRVGEDDRHITSIDEDGVALAAIKALHAESARTRASDAAQIGQLRRELAAERAHDRRVDAELARITGALRR